MKATGIVRRIDDKFSRTVKVKLSLRNILL